MRKHIIINRRDIVHAGCSAAAPCYRPTAASRIPLYPNSLTLHVPVLNPSAYFPPKKARKSGQLKPCILIGQWLWVRTVAGCFCSLRINPVFRSRLLMLSVSRSYVGCERYAQQRALAAPCVTSASGTKRKNVFKSGIIFFLKICNEQICMSSFVLNGCYY